MSELIREDLEEAVEQAEEAEENEEETKTEEDDGFVVDDDEKAEWCMEKIREAKADIAKWKEHFKKQQDGILRENNNTIARMEARLEKYFWTQPHKKATQSESYPLPSGKLVFKKQDPEYEREDETLIDWLKKNAPQYVKTVESVDWDALKKTTSVIGEDLVSEDGEPIPGVTVKRRPDVFKVQLKKEGK